VTELDELDIEQQAVLESLVSPFEEVDVKYDLDIDIQRHILGMLMTDNHFMTQSLDLIQSKYFVNVAHESIHASVTGFFETYKAMPHKFYIRQELSRKAKDDDQAVYFLAELDAIAEYYVPGVEHREYLLDKITNFAKTEAMRIAFSKCIKMLNQPNNREVWGDISNTLREAQMVDRNHDVGLDYFRTVDQRYDEMKEEVENKEAFPTGFPDIDEALGGGLGRGEIGAWIALPGAGKSLALVKNTVANLVRGKKVLFISLEMDQPKIAQRFDAQLAIQNISELHLKKTAVVQALEEFVKDYEDRRRLIIKQFPSGGADVNTIRAFLQQLELHGFKPDLLIVDYIGEMKDLPNMPVHESREKLIQQLRGLGTENGHATFTALQPNRSAKEAQEGTTFIDDGQIGDSYNQFRPLDAFWSINQTQLEKNQGLGRVFVIKHRNGASKFGFEIGYDYGPDKCREEGVCSLNMFQVEKQFYHEKMNEAREEAKETTKIDALPKGKLKLGNTQEDAIQSIIGNNYDNGEAR